MYELLTSLEESTKVTIDSNLPKSLSIVQVDQVLGGASDDVRSGDSRLGEAAAVRPLFTFRYPMPETKAGVGNYDRVYEMNNPSAFVPFLSQGN